MAKLYVFVLGICLALLGILLFTDVGSQIQTDLQNRIRNLNVFELLQGPSGPPGPVGDRGPAGEAVLGGTTNYDSLSLSEDLTVSGTTTLSQVLNLNTIGITARPMPMLSGTSTPCSVLSPAATTTLLSYTFKQTTSSSSAIFWEFATSTTPYSTTTPFASTTIVASDLGIRSYTGPAAGASEGTKLGGGATNVNMILSPSTYIVARGGLHNLGGAIVGGTCRAVFIDTE